MYRKGTYIKRRTMRCIGRVLILREEQCGVMGRVLILREEQCGVWEGYLY